MQDKHPSNENSIYNVTLKIETKFVKSSNNEALNVRYSDDPDAPEVRISEEDILQKYPYDYKKLTAKLVDRYTDFKQNQRYHNIRIPLKEDEKYCLIRKLDPKNPKSMTKEYYSTEVFKVFDKHYSMKKLT